MRHHTARNGARATGRRGRSRGRRPQRGPRLALAGVLAAAAFGGGCRLESLNGNGDSAAIEPDLQAQVAALLDRQSAAWNAGDLDGFMGGYDRSPTTTYLGSGGLIEGYEGIRQRYAPGFAPGAERDSLRVTDLRVREVETRVAVATARYILERDGAVTSSGQFTLVLLNAEGAWLIVHDQSAADPADAADAGS